ncbi:MAG: DUF86 domain-containing protein [Candidatus Kariarchaeaceae archaeon]
MVIPTTRQQRYSEKLYHLEKRLRNAIEWKEGFKNSEMQKLAVYKAIQEIFEVIADVSAMILKDLNANPKDDYSNFKRLFDLEIISKNHLALLNEGNGFRNRLIHSYNGLDDDLVLQSFERMSNPIKSLMEVFKEWVNNFYKK